MKIRVVKTGLGGYQKGENKIIKTYRNTDDAVKDILKRLN